MLQKAFVLVACVLSVHLCSAELFDQNEIIDFALQSYYQTMNMSGWAVGCCPLIVLGPKGSIIQPFSGWRGNVALIVNYGTCSNMDKGFVCSVNWGDGITSQTFLDDFGPCQLAHQYAKVDSQYTVVAQYCSAPGGLKPGPDDCGKVRCCRTYVRTIDTSFNPGY